MNYFKNRYVKSGIWLGFAVLCGSIWGSLSALAVPLSPKKESVAVLATPKRSAEVIGTISKGDTLESDDRLGMFWKVHFQGRVGYVSVMDVQRAAHSAGGLQKAVSEAAAESRNQDDIAGARSRSAVMGVRGLSDGEAVAAAGNVRPDIKSVYKMEDRVVNQEDVTELADLVLQEIQTRLDKRQR